MPSSEALSHLRVIDLTRVRAGPTCVKQFADWGADVVKVEMPSGDADDGFGPRQGSDFQNLHRNKRSLTLNLKDPRGVEVLKRLVQSADVVIDATDNFATRHAVNRACVKFSSPLVSGAGVRFDGQIAVFDLRRHDSPCYHCLFPENGDVEEMRCAVMGVFAPLVGIIGSMQAAEALKLLMGIGRDLTGRLLLLDALTMEWRSVRLKKDPQCAVCGGGDTGQRSSTAACATDR